MKAEHHDFGGRKSWSATGPSSGSAFPQGRPQGILEDVSGTGIPEVSLEVSPKAYLKRMPEGKLKQTCSVPASDLEMI